MRYPTKYWQCTKNTSGIIKKELVEKDGSMDYVQQVKTKTLWYEYYEEPSLRLNKNETKPPTKAQKIIKDIFIGVFVTVIGGLLLWLIISLF